jgi:hypothetical protein
VSAPPLAAERSVKSKKKLCKFIGQATVPPASDYRLPENMVGTVADPTKTKNILLILSK